VRKHNCTERVRTRLEWWVQSPGGGQGIPKPSAASTSLIAGVMVMDMWTEPALGLPAGHVHAGVRGERGSALSARVCS